MLVLDPGVGPVRSAAFSPDGRLAVVGEKRREIVVCGLSSTDSSVCRLPTDFAPGGRLRFSADGLRVGCQNRQERPFVIELTGGRNHPLVGRRDPLTWGEMTPDGGGVLLAISLPPRTPEVEYRSRLTCRPVEPSSGNTTRWAIDLDFMCLPHFGFLSGDEFVNVEAVTSGPESPVRFRFVVRELDTGRERSGSPEYTQEAVRLVSASESRRVAAIRTNQILLWSPDEPTRLTTWKNPTARQFTEIAFHPSGLFLAAVNLDTTIRIHDPATGEVMRTYDWEVGKLRCVAFSPDGLLAAAGSDSGRIVIWDMDL